MTSMIFEGDTQSYSGADELLSSSLSWGKACKLHASGQPSAGLAEARDKSDLGRIPPWAGPNSVNRQNKSAGRERPALRSRFGTYCLASSVLAGFVWAIVQFCSPTLKRAKRRTEMFSPSLPILVAISCETEIVCSLMKG